MTYFMHDPKFLVSAKDIINHSIPLMRKEYSQVDSNNLQAQRMNCTYNRFAVGRRFI
jgi:hypothetical protein